jgi:TetR/AcrR family transcriptional repressor of mexJK operon
MRTSTSMKKVSRSLNAAPAHGPGPGRPKDPEKRAAILEAAKRLFPQHGFEGTSMDAVAADAGVSKLTVYSHFGAKEALFVETVRCKCASLLPTTLFEVDVNAPVHGQLLGVARVFFELMMTEGSLDMHRTLVASSRKSPKLAKLFWDAGPVQLQAALATMLDKEVAARHLDIDDTRRAASQFFALLKGEHHARMLFGCGRPTATETRAHLEATVTMFVRAYAPR